VPKNPLNHDTVNYVKSYGVLEHQLLISGRNLLLLPNVLYVEATLMLLGNAKMVNGSMPSVLR